MLLRTIIDVLRRRWHVAAVGLVCVVAAAGLAVRATPPTYSYSAAILLLPPEVSRGVSSDQLDFTQGNPLFYLGSLGQAKDILIASLSSKQTSDLVLADFPDVTYEAASDVLNTGPIIVITTESTTRAEADDALEMLVDQADQNLINLQTDLGIAPSALIDSHVLTRDTTPDVSRTDSIRAGVVVGGGLVLVLFFLLSVLDSLLQRRRREDPPTDADGAAPPPPPQQAESDGAPAAVRTGEEPAHGGRGAARGRGRAHGQAAGRGKKSTTT